MVSDSRQADSQPSVTSDGDIAHKIAAEQHLTLVQYCGGGGFGQVWLALDAGGWRRAFKIVNLAHGAADVEREMRGVREHCSRVNDEESLLTIFHQGITDGYFWYLMQLADDAHDSNGGYLADTLELRLQRQGCFTPQELRPIILQILEGVHALHSHCLVHRDIKPANVLFIRGRAVLGDVGLVEDSSAVSLGGTEGFVPREIQARMTQSIDGQMQDLFAVGCLIRVMLGVFDEVRGKGFVLPTDRVARRLNQFANRACSPQASERYHDVEAFRRDFERCYGFHAVFTSGQLMAMTVGVMGLILGVLGLSLVMFWESGAPSSSETAGEAPSTSAGQARSAGPASSSSGESVLPSSESALPSSSLSTVAEAHPYVKPVQAVNWYTVLSRTRTLRDYTFGGIMPQGLEVIMEPHGSGVGFFDHENLRCRRYPGFLGASSITLRFQGPLPRSFELIWLCGGDFSGLTETATLQAKDGSGSLSVHMVGGGFRQGRLPEHVRGLPRSGFMSVHRLICISGRLRFLVDGLPMGVAETGLDVSSWDSLTLRYDVQSGGEIYFSSMRLNEFLE